MPTTRPGELSRPGCRREIGPQPEPRLPHVVDTTGCPHHDELPDDLDDWHPDDPGSAERAALAQIAAAERADLAAEIAADEARQTWPDRLAAETQRAAEVFPLG